MNGRNLAKAIFTPPAKVLVKWGVTPNWVTGIGALATSAVALTLFPLGHLWPGALALGALVLTDALDGTMARLTGNSTKFGAFLDSTLDRVADAAVFVGLTIYLVRLHDTLGAVAGVAALALGSVVPYARAKAEALGFSATVGIAERGDRLLVALVAAFAVGLGAPRLVLTIGLAVLALASAVTVCQRAYTVQRQARAGDASG
ncbi:MAG: CDP-alcohol phosphatidyltransferase family protein [Micrococcales bacterium]|nr:CDP-alcohol phosphatidyltransferase family protein [Micrococcales bacterium]